MWQHIAASVDADSLVKVLSAVVTALVGFAWKRYMEARPKVVQFFVHSGAVSIPAASPAPGQPTPTAGIVHTHALVIRNTGAKSATNLRVGHHRLPPFSIAPPVKYTTNGTEILIPNLVPGEALTLTYVYGPDLTWDQVHAYTKTDEMLVQHLRVQPQPMPSKSVLIFVGILMFTGAATIVYGLLRLLYEFLTS